MKMKRHFPPASKLVLFVSWFGMFDSTHADQAGRQYAENALHARPDIKVTVGIRDADMVGSDHRALQAAVDYVANLGGGTVEIGPGEYLMRDSLNLRSRVTVRGAGASTILKKAREYRSPARR